MPIETTMVMQLSHLQRNRERETQQATIISQNAHLGWAGGIFSRGEPLAPVPGNAGDCPCPVVRP